MPKERVQKILARAGIASRRKAEELIIEGVVTINGKIAKLGDQAEWGEDSVKVRGKLLHSTEAPIYLSFYKPKGVISMFGDPDGRPSLSEYLGSIKTRLFPVGRLDFNSEGIILLTNDGALTEQLQKREDVIRVYHVKIKGHPDSEMLKRLERGAKIGNRMIRPESIRLTEEYAKKAQVEVVMVGAGAVDLKAYFEMKGFLVERITRVAFGHLRLGGMKPGEFKHLNDTQAKALTEQPELGMKRQQFQELKTRKSAPEVRDPSKTPKIIMRKSADRDVAGDSRGERPAFRGARPEYRGDRPAPRSPRPDSRGARPDSRGPRPDFRAPRTEWSKSPRSDDSRSEKRPSYASGAKRTFGEKSDRPRIGSSGGFSDKPRSKIFVRKKNTQR
jgi:23S rRNA pseudouridine2605 synthase